MDNHLKYMREYAGPLMERGVLDVGSGNGGFVISVAELGFSVAGIELNSDKVLISHQKLLEKNLQADIRKGFAEQLPFPSASFGFVNCSEVIEHVEDTVVVLQEIYRVLQQDGIAYISFHNRFGYKDQHFHIVGINWIPRKLADILCRRNKKIRINKGDSGYQLLGEMNYFTYRQTVRMLQAIGFQVQDTRELRIKKQYQNQIIQRSILFVYRIFRSTVINTFHVLATKT